MKKLLTTILIILLSYSSFITYKYNKLKKETPEYVILHDKIPGDSVFTEVIKYKPKSYIIKEVDSVFIPADSIGLVNKYDSIYRVLYASKYYVDTLKNDSSATVIVNTYLSQNSIDSLKMNFKNNRITSINNIIVNSNNKLGVGIIAGNNVTMPIVQYKIYNDINLIGGYNINNKSINLGLIYTIK